MVKNNTLLCFTIAPRQGLEPQLTVPETAVLPLDDRGIKFSAEILHINKNSTQVLKYLKN
jgi:hypothetical protein